MLSLLMLYERWSGGWASASAESAEDETDEFGNPLEAADVSPLEKDFHKAAARLRAGLSKGLDDACLLYLYAHYKQALHGPAEDQSPEQRPGAFCGPTARRKWTAWSRLGQLGREEAMRLYVQRMKREFPSLGEEPGPSSPPGGLGLGPSRMASAEVGSDDASTEDEAEAIAAVKRLRGEGELGLWLREREESLGRAGLAALLAEEDGEGMRALHWAADRGFVGSVAALLDAGAEVDAVDSAGQTALHYAGTCDHVAVARLLVQRGADKTALDHDGNPPLNPHQLLALHAKPKRVHMF